MFLVKHIQAYSVDFKRASPSQRQSIHVISLLPLCHKLRDACKPSEGALIVRIATACQMRKGLGARVVVGIRKNIRLNIIFKHGMKKRTSHLAHLIWICIYR